MRKLTVTRSSEDAFPAIPGFVCVETNEVPDCVINGIFCKKLGTVACGASCVFPLDDASAVLFVVADPTAPYGNNMAFRAPAGPADVSVSGSFAADINRKPVFRFVTPEKSESSSSYAPQPATQPAGAQYGQAYETQPAAGQYGAAQPDVSAPVPPAPQPAPKKKKSAGAIIVSVIVALVIIFGARAVGRLVAKKVFLKQEPTTVTSIFSPSSTTSVFTFSAPRLVTVGEVSLLLSDAYQETDVPDGSDAMALYVSEKDGSAVSFLRDDSLKDFAHEYSVEEYAEFLVSGEDDMSAPRQTYGGVWYTEYKRTAGGSDYSYITGVYKVSPKVFFQVTFYSYSDVYESQRDSFLEMLDKVIYMKVY